MRHLLLIVFLVFGQSITAYGMFKSATWNSDSSNVRHGGSWNPSVSGLVSSSGQVSTSPVAVQSTPPVTRDDIYLGLARLNGYNPASAKNPSQRVDVGNPAQLQQRVEKDREALLSAQELQRIRAEEERTAREHVENIKTALENDKQDRLAKLETDSAVELAEYKYLLDAEVESLKARLAAGVENTRSIAESFCFTGETLVSVKDNSPAGYYSKAISEIQVGDQLVSCNVARGKVCEFSSVLQVIARTAVGIINLKLGGTSLKVTGNHLFYLRNRAEWVRADELVRGDALQTIGGEAILIENIDSAEGEYTVYNLSVSGQNNYYAGGVLVHNCNLASVAATVELTAEVAPAAVLSVPGTVFFGSAVAVGYVLHKATALGEDAGDSAASAEAATEQKLLEQKSTGRTAPKDLKEKLAIEEAMANPGGSHAKGMEMKDPRYPAKDGWIKMEQEVNGTKIHYIKNTKTGAVADFKFK